MQVEKPKLRFALAHVHVPRLTLNYSLPLRRSQTCSIFKLLQVNFNRFVPVTRGVTALAVLDLARLAVVEEVGRADRMVDFLPFLLGELFLGLSLVQAFARKVRPATGGLCFTTIGTVSCFLHFMAFLTVNVLGRHRLSETFSDLGSDVVS